MTDDQSPEVPADLAGPGRAVWVDVLADYDLDVPSQSLLHEIARTVDELERLRAALDAEPTTVAGSMGQPRPNPLFDEVRKHRETLARLVKALDLPDEDEDAPAPSMASVRARDAATRRWRREKYLRGAS